MEPIDADTPPRRSSLLHRSALAAIVTVFLLIGSLQILAIPRPADTPLGRAGLEACSFPTPDDHYRCVNDSGQIIEYVNGCRHDRSTTTSPEYLGCDL